MLRILLRTSWRAFLAGLRAAQSEVREARAPGPPRLVYSAREPLEASELPAPHLKLVGPVCPPGFSKKDVETVVRVSEMFARAGYDWRP